MNIIFKNFSSSQNELWDDINLKAEYSSFLSSSEWIEFQRSLNNEIDQYLIYAKVGEKEILIGNLFIEIFRRRFVKYAYSPYGPIINLKSLYIVASAVSENQKNLALADFYKSFYAFAKDYAKEKGLNIFRVDPLLSLSFRHVLERIGFKKSLAPAQAVDTWVMDLEGTEEEVFMKIKKETRYYIRRAEKLGVKIIKAKNNEEVKEFGKLMSETTERKQFGNYDAKYFLKQWTQLEKKGITEIYLAKYKNKYISGALFNFYKNVAYYAHGASTSDQEMLKLSSPYLLHWEIMKDAKERGCTKYNFWGVVPRELKHHTWRGISDFKMKFPGEMISYVGPYEVGSNFIKWSLQRAVDWWAYRKERY